MEINPLWIPIVAVVSGTLMIVLIVGIVFWFKERAKELEYHQDLRVREMDHLRKMKELEIELEKAKSRGSSGQTA